MCAAALAKMRATRDQAGAGIAAQFRCWLRAAEAEMAAAARQQADCRAALDLAADHLSQPTAEHLASLALNDTHLARWRGNCLVHFCDPATIADLNNAEAVLR